MPHTKSHKQRNARWIWPGASRWRRRGLDVLAALLLALQLAPAIAVDLGDIRVHSWLGRQIKASIPLVGDDAGSSEARCFKGALVNLHGEPVSALKLGLQHTTGGSFLLLFGGSAVDEPAATVVVENICGTGGSRDYAVLLDLVPASQVAAVEVNATTPRKQAVADANDREPIWIPDTVYPIPGMPPMRMASMLGAHDEGTLRPASLRMPSPDKVLAPAALRLDRAYEKFGLARHGNAISGTTKLWMTGALSALLLLGAAAWVVYRIRAMRAASRPWLPIDERIDSGNVA